LRNLDAKDQHIFLKFEISRFDQNALDGAAIPWRRLRPERLYGPPYRP
jgi:hypothetical protein